MATITVSAVLTRCAVLLQDPTNIRWPQAELLDWLNDGQREIALYKPNAFVKNLSRPLTAGTKQALPADGVSLVDVVRNMGTNGTTPGAAVRAVAREILDSQTPNWHAATPATAIKHFVYSVLDPKNFYVYPPSDGTGQVEVIYAAAPADATLVGTITLDDIFVTALVNYVLYRAYSKDAEFAANASAAAAYYQAFQGNLAGKAGAEASSNPNAALMPFNPNLPGGNK